MMKILMVNKFLYPNGGSENYIFKLGEQLQKMGHEVQFFGMEHKNRIVGNHAESYTSSMDFHTGRLEKLFYPLKIIYSREARKKIRVVLDDFAPDVVHLNNFNFQLTPSIIYEIKKYEKQSHKKVKLVYTAHDFQLVCPNHMMKIPASGENCERCLANGFIECVNNRCIHNSRIKSLLGSIEAILYNRLKTYHYIEKIICPSEFIEKKLLTNSVFSGKTIVMHNFVNPIEQVKLPERKYVLYFGRLAEEKGIITLLQACQRLPEIPFIFAGNGPLEEEVKRVENVQYVGFQKGEAISKLITEAAFSVYPSEWYENCPFSVMESIAYGTPVIGANIGGIPELIRDGETGELFESGNKDELCTRIERLWKDKKLLMKYYENCKNKYFDSVADYCDKLFEVYQG